MSIELDEVFKLSLSVLTFSSDPEQNHTYNLKSGYLILNLYKSFGHLVILYKLGYGF
jgi:hypothetical protein